MVIADLVDTLSRIGAIGGILSIIGVGLLILLVASQSRQIRSMREWIDEEPQRQQETAQRVIAEVQRRIAAARDRRSAAAGGLEPATPGAPARPLPAAPGTLGATPEAQKIVAAKQEAPAVPGATPADGSVPPPPGGPDGPKFAPLTPAGGADSVEGAPPTDEPAIVSDFLNQETQAADALPGDEPLAVPASASSDVRFGDEQFDLEDDPAPRGGSRVLFGVGVVALLAGIVLAGTVLFGGGDDEPGPRGGDAVATTADPEDPAESTPAPAPVDPASVNLRVLNGTSVSGLAQRVSDSLKAKSYAPERPDTFSGAQTVTETSVEFRPGNKPAALAVAKDLGLTSSAVRAIDPDLSVAAGETAEVVVLTGTDLDSPSSTTAE